MLNLRIGTALLTALMVFLVIFIASCNQYEDMAPVIVFNDIQPKVLKADSDSLQIRISYFDQNGDLGDNNGEVKNLFVLDNRINIPHEFRIQRLYLKNKQVPIQGDLNIVLGNIPAIEKDKSFEKVSFTVWITDRKGNISNKMITDSVKLVW